MIQLIDDSFFNEEIDKGCQFYTRKTNYFREKRTLNIIDEIEEKLKMQRAFEESEAKRDMTYEEFLGKYLDHIEGRVTADERNVRPLTAEGDDQGKPPGQSPSGMNTLNEEGKEGGEYEKKSEKLNESSTLNKSRGGDDALNKSKDSMFSKEDYKFEIPESCYLILMKGNQIEKLHKKYLLLSHPFPLIEGEMVLF